MTVIALTKISNERFLGFFLFLCVCGWCILQIAKTYPSFVYTSYHLVFWQ